MELAGRREFVLQQDGERRGRFDLSSAKANRAIRQDRQVEVLEESELK